MDNGAPDRGGSARIIRRYCPPLDKRDLRAPGLPRSAPQRKSSYSANRKPAEIELMTAHELKTIEGTVTAFGAERKIALK